MPNPFDVVEEDPFDLPDAYMDAQLPATFVADKDQLRAPTVIRKNRELTKARQKLTRVQRIFIKALEMNNFSVKPAYEAMRQIGEKVNLQTCYVWNRSAKVQTVLELMTEEILAKAGVTRKQILLDVAKVRDSGMTPRKRYVQGQATGEYEIEGGTALKALELLGKNKKLWNEDTSTRVAVQVELIDWSGPRAEVIEGKVLSDPEPTSTCEVSPDGEGTGAIREVG